MCPIKEFKFARKAKIIKWIYLNSSLLLADLLGCLRWGNLGLLVVATNVDVVCILDVEDVSTLLNMVGTAEESVHLLESDSSCLGDEEDHEYDQQAVYSGKEEKGVTVQRLASIR
jgi:hypothetical protein